MVARKVGTIFCKQELSPFLTIFRLHPEAGSRFPSSKAGQYIALRRDDCELTKKIASTPDGRPVYGPDLDESGRQKTGPVTHSYSIASAPCDHEIATGRANNVLRHVFGLPMKEEETLRNATAGKEDLTKAVDGLKRTPKPQLPTHLTAAALSDRLDPSTTVIMSCGNPEAMADIELIADLNQVRFEKEEW